MSNYHFATLWETITDVVPARDAVIQGDRHVTWRQYDTDAARLARAFEEAGITAGAKVGLFLYNSPEYLIGQYAAFKVSGCPINVNYRYLDDELVYLLNNADVEAVMFHTSLGDRIERIIDRLPLVKMFIQVSDDDHTFGFASGYEKVLTEHAPLERREHDPNELYMLYTGGTTGMPKGAMYRNEGMARGTSSAYALAGVVPPETIEEVPAAVGRLVEINSLPITIPTCPIMHGTGMWVGCMPALNSGGTVVLLESRHFDAHELWRAVEKCGVKAVVIVGDPFARPMAAALEEAAAKGTPYDASSLGVILSSGAMWSMEIKQRLLVHADLMIYDVLGSTEAGSMGSMIMTRAGVVGQGTSTAKFDKDPAMKVIDENNQEVVAGSGIIGRVIKDVSTGCFGYYKDESKTASTFITFEGTPYVLSGDMASVEADGSLSFVGRGSQTINSMGEKVFPEEVEEAIKTHSSIDDCLVVGIPDEHFGQRVTAVASVRQGADRPTPDEVIAHVKARLSHYKAPKTVVLVDHVKRAPNGKADYPWAKAAAAEALGVTL